MNNLKNNRKIRDILVFPQFQIKYIVWLFATSFCLILLLSFIFFYFIRENYLLLVDLSPMEELVKQQLYHELFILKLSLFGASLVFLICIFIVGLFYSHRVAGPLFHLRRVMLEVSSGNYSARVRLRPGDEFREVADVFNRMLDDCERRGAK